MIRKLNDLEDKELENLAYDLLIQKGLRNLRWRTPGADGGRDLEGENYYSDFSGELVTETWYVECKRYASSLSWSKVYEKIAYADNRSVDYLLIFTNSNPSPNCENEINAWNRSNRTPTIRFWRGYEIEKNLLQFPSVSIKYGLLERKDAPWADSDIGAEIAKIAMSANSAYTFEQAFSDQLEICASLSELMFIRQKQLKENGKFSKIEEAMGFNSSQKETFAQALLRKFLSFSLRPTSEEIVEEKNTWRLSMIKCRRSISDELERSLRVIAFWLDIEISIAQRDDDDGFEFGILERS